MTLIYLGIDIIKDLAFIDFLMDLFLFFLKNGPILKYFRACSNLLLMSPLKVVFWGMAEIIKSFQGLRHSGVFGLGIVLS